MMITNDAGLRPGRDLPGRTPPRPKDSVQVPDEHGGYVVLLPMMDQIGGPIAELGARGHSAGHELRLYGSWDLGLLSLTNRQGHELRVRWVDGRPREVRFRHAGRIDRPKGTARDLLNLLGGEA